MPDWAITLLVAIIAALPGTAAWYKARLDNSRQKEKQASEQEQLLRSVADMASATALQCLESATKEMHIQLDKQRDQIQAQQDELMALRERLAETERQLAKIRTQLEDEQARSARAEARMMAQISKLEAERAALKLRIEELEGCR